MGPVSGCLGSRRKGRYSVWLSHLAGVAQLVEHQLPKLRVASSSLVARFDESPLMRAFSLLRWTRLRRSESSSPSASRLARLCPLANSSTYGSAARMPRVERLVGGVALERVQPDDAVREPREPRRLLGEQRRVAELETVRGDHDDRPAGQAAVAVLVEERLQRLADPGAAARGRGRPRRRGASASSGRAACRARASAGSGACRSRTPPSAVRAHGGVGEEDERARIVAHRAGHVEQQHEPPRLAHAALAPGELDRLAAVRNERRSVRRRSGACPRRDAGAGGAARRRGRASARHQPGERVELLARAGGEALLAQQLDRAREPPSLRPRARPRPGARSPRTRSSARAAATGAAEERGEDRVVDGDVLAAATRASPGLPSRASPGSSSAAARQKLGDPTRCRRGARASRSSRPKRVRTWSSSVTDELGSASSARRRSSRVLTAQPERVAADGDVDRRRRRARASAAAQSIASATPGCLTGRARAAAATVTATDRASRSDDAGHAQADDLHLALERPGSRSSGRGSGA